MIFLKAFIVGGIICALVQIVIDKTKVTPARIMVSLVCIGVVLGAIGIYEPLTKWAGCGATVPLLGFGNNLWSQVFWDCLKVVLRQVPWEFQEL